MRRLALVFGLSLSAGLLISCGAERFSNSSAVEKPTIGVLLASHGDIDDAEKELRHYIETSFQKNIGIPLPSWSRDILVNPAYFLSVKLVRAQYDIIGPTRYRANAELQRVKYPGESLSRLQFYQSFHSYGSRANEKRWD